MKIVIDGLGGDNPLENERAYNEMLHEYDDAELVFVKEESKEKTMQKSFEIFKKEEDSVLVSMGETRDLIIGVMNNIGIKEGIIRPVFCPILPTFKGGIVGLCDSGAIINTSPEHLLQYGLLGSDFIKKTYKIENPRVALLNIGVEEEKGDDLHREAFKLLQNAHKEGKINFVGNTESRDFQSGDYDLVVSDGFSGNIMLKAVEGVVEGLSKRLFKFIPKEELEFINYHNYGGSALLGANKLVIKVHGSSDKTAIKAAIKQAYDFSSIE